MNSTLICKLTQLPIKKSLYGGKIKPPNGAQSCDLVKIAKENKEKIDIITFRDKAKDGQIGKILRRYILKKGHYGETVIQKNYFQIGAEKILNPEKDGIKEFLEVTGRKIFSVTKFEDEYFEKSTEIQTVTHRKNNTPILHISKIVSKPFGNAYIEDETQSLYQYSKDYPTKGYKIKTCLKSKQGFFNDVFPSTIEFKDFPKNLVKRFKEDIYFPLHLYSFKEFKKMAPTVAQHPQHKTELPFEIKWFCDSKANKYGYFDGKVNLNSRSLVSRFHVICSSAHEKEHAYQMEQCIFDYLKKGFAKNPKFIPKDLYKQYKGYYISGGKCKINDKAEVKLIKENFENYIKSEDDKIGYKDQFIEMSARVAGGLAEQVYRKSAQDLKEEFLFAPDYLIGYTETDKLLRAWNVLHTS